MPIKSHWTIVSVGALKLDRHTDLQKAWEEAERPVEQAVEKLIQECAKKSGTFEDSSFGPSKSDPDGSLAFYRTGKAPDRNYADPSQCEWRRPRWANDFQLISGVACQESSVLSDATEDEDEDTETKANEDETLSATRGSWFCEEARLFADGVNANDVIQGRLGDCWLLSGMSLLASRPDLLAKVFWRSKDRKRQMEMCKYGFRVCRFFKDNQWYFVIVDDSLPVFSKSNKPVFAHCKDRRELWVPLLEKAYAKLHGSYDSLIRGYVDSALRDFTGLACEELVLRRGHVGFQPKYEQWLTNDKMWNRLHEYANEWGCMMGCSIQPDPNEANAKVEQKVDNTGLFMRHAYALLDVGTIQTDEGKVRLVRLRNPWGFGEWSGPWSDNSEEFKKYRKELKKEFGHMICHRRDISSTSIPIDSNAKDGTFFMTWEAWKQYFTVFFAAIDFPVSWAGQRVCGLWTRENSGGNHTCKTWPINPRHRLRVLQPSSRIFIQLNQEDPRQESGKDQAGKQFPLSFRVLSAKDQGGRPPDVIPNSQPSVEQPPYKRHLSIDVDLTLDAGEYVIVPSTLNPGSIGKYAVQVYSDKPIALEDGELIAEEEEQNGEHVTFDYDTISVVPSTSQVQNWLKFEEYKAQLCERASRAGVSLKQLANMFKDSMEDGITWQTWKDRLAKVGIAPNKAEFDVFSGVDSTMDRSELDNLVEHQNAYIQSYGTAGVGDESFFTGPNVIEDFGSGDEALPGHSMDSYKDAPNAQRDLLEGLVTASKLLRNENEDLRAELDSIREEQARMMSVLLIYGKILQSFDGEVLKPEELLKKSTRHPYNGPDLDKLFSKASKALASHPAPKTHHRVNEFAPVQRRTTRGSLSLNLDLLDEGDEFLAIKPWKGAIKAPSKIPRVPPLEHKLELGWVYGFNSSARDAVFSNSSGQLVYFAAALGIIYDCGKHSQTFFSGHTDDIICMDMDVRGEKVVTGQMGKKPFACVWDARTGSLICKLEDSKLSRQVTRVQFSEDGSEVLTVGGDDSHTLILFDAHTGKKKLDRKGEKSDCFCVTHNGKQFITGGAKYLVSLDKSLKSKRMSFGEIGGGIPSAVKSAVRLAQGYVATGTSEGKVQLWSPDLKCVDSVNMKTPVASLWFDSSSSLLYSGHHDGTLVSWTVKNDKLVQEGSGAKFEHPVRAVLKNHVALASGVIIDRKSEANIVTGHFQGELWGLAAHPSSNRIATAGDDKILRIWDAKGRTQHAQYTLPAVSRTLAWSSDGRFLAVGLAENKVMLFDADSLKHIQTAVKGKKKKSAQTNKSRPPYISCLEFSPNGKYLAAGSSDSKVYIMSASDLSKKFAFSASTSTVTHIDFSKTSEYIRTSDASYELLFYSLVTQKQHTFASDLKDTEWATTNCPLTWETEGIWQAEADGTDINACCRLVSSDPAAPALLATSDDFGEVRLFPFPFPEDMKGKAQFAIGSGHASHVTNVAFVSLDTLVSTGGNDRTVMQWNIVSS